MSEIKILRYDRITLNCLEEPFSQLRGLDGRVPDLLISSASMRSLVMSWLVNTESIEKDPVRNAWLRLYHNGVIHWEESSWMPNGLIAMMNRDTKSILFVEINECRPQPK